MTRGTSPSPWETRMLETVREGGLPSGMNFLTLALNVPKAAMDTLEELCAEMGIVEPETSEEIADMFAFESPEQREEFIRRLF